MSRSGRRFPRRGTLRADQHSAAIAVVAAHRMQANAEADRVLLRVDTAALDVALRNALAALSPGAVAPARRDGRRPGAH